jgi:copper chaperone CopZ
MYSTFLISKSDCMTCTNKTLKSLGTLRGVFGAEIDQIDGKVTVSHTNEITRKEIAEMLLSLGYPELENEEEQNQEINYDEPSIWGCAL